MFGFLDDKNYLTKISCQKMLWSSYQLFLLKMDELECPTEPFPFMIEKIHWILVLNKIRVHCK